jgi:hypothetical protein
MEQLPLAVPALLHAQWLAERGVDLAVPVPGGEALWARARGSFAPLATLLRGPAGAWPLLEGRHGGEAYLCREGACELPARDEAALQAQLRELHPGVADGEA